MLAAASVAEPMAKPRQNARLCHNDDGRAAGGGRSPPRCATRHACGGATGATASASPPSRSSQNATSDASAGSCASRRSTSRRSSAPSTPSTYSAAIKVAAVGRAYGVVRRSSFETGSEFQQPAPDPALHRAERHAHARRQFLVGRAVEERRPDRGRMARLQLLQAAGEALVLLRQLDPLEPRPGRDRSPRRRLRSARMRRLIALARSRSIARLRAIATSQVIGLARPGSKAAALRHTVT